MGILFSHLPILLRFVTTELWQSSEAEKGISRSGNVKMIASSSRSRSIQHKRVLKDITKRIKCSTPQLFRPTILIADPSRKVADLYDMHPIPISSENFYCPFGIFIAISI